MEIKDKEMKMQSYLKKFEKYVYPEWIKEELDSEVKGLGDEIINLLKEKELTYVDAYVTLEYVYRNLKAMSEYTHL